MSKRSKWLFMIGVCALGVMLGLTGCDWTSGGGVETWVNSGYDWVNFSGDYRSPDGKILVREFGVTNNIGEISVTNSSRNEVVDVGDGSRTEFSGRVHGVPIPGTLTIVVGSYRFTDAANNTSLGTYNLAVTPNDGSSGTINYASRFFTLRFPAPINNGTAIEANYLYLVTEENAGQGNHGEPIYSFVVYQTGNNLQLVDSNGTVYNGSIGTMNTTGGLPYDPNNPAVTPPTTGEVFAQFYVTGNSQGYNVSIAGTLRGTLGENRLTGRTMQATYVESGGHEADIAAVAN